MTRGPLVDALREEGGAHVVARRGDPETSWSAAQSVYGIRESQARVYVFLSRWGAMTDEALIGVMQSNGVKMSESGVRTRRHELVNLGLVEASTEYGMTKNAGRSIKWRAVPFYEWERRKSGIPLQLRME